jgi:hypothetical protein
LRAFFENRRFALALFELAIFADELVDCGHKMQSKRKIAGAIDNERVTRTLKFPQENSCWEGAKYRE